MKDVLLKGEKPKFGHQIFHLLKVVACYLISCSVIFCVASNSKTLRYIHGLFFQFSLL